MSSVSVNSALLTNLGSLSVSRAKIAASGVSVAVLFMALLMMFFAGKISLDRTEKIEIREVSIMSVPPPSPPPTVQYQSVETAVSLQVEGAGPVIKMQRIVQDVRVDKPIAPKVVLRETQWPSMDIDWQAFELNELDRLPSLLTSLHITLPKQLKRNGIRTLAFRLDVMIDERGRVRLISIVQNSFPELVGEIEKLALRSRFTPPIRNNEPVKARFIWPVEIEI